MGERRVPGIEPSARLFCPALLSAWQAVEKCSDRQQERGGLSCAFLYWLLIGDCAGCLIG